MKTTNLLVPIESEKLAALTRYAAKKEVSVTAELSDAVDKLYEKLVPFAVREYIDTRIEPVSSPPVRAKPQRPADGQ